MSTTTEYIDITGVAKIVRADLAKHFPGTKFSVRCSRYSMGSNCSVRWTDGPSTRQVDATIGHYGGTTFDSEYQGRRVRFAGMGPSCSRDVTSFDGWSLLAERMIRERCTLSEDGKRFGNDWVDNLASNMVHACDFRESAPLERAFRRVVLREDV